MLPRDLRSMTLTSLFTALIALLAQVSIPLPFSPVPITGQVFGVFLTAGILGSRLGVSAILLYIIMGVLGLPVFSLGRSGFHQLVGPTGGYLIGFVIASYIIGCFSERSHKASPTVIAVGMIIAMGAVYATGSLHLSLVLGLSLPEALSIGVLPYILLDLIKIALAATTASIMRNTLIKANLMAHYRNSSG
jgi:biotin transport system substrate-specific component